MLGWLGLGLGVMVVEWDSLDARLEVVDGDGGMESLIGHQLEEGKAS